MCLFASYATYTGCSDSEKLAYKRILDAPSKASEYSRALFLELAIPRTPEPDLVVTVKVNDPEFPRPVVAVALEPSR